MKRQENRIAFQGGAYSLAITAVVLAILVVINVLAASLPSSLMKYDISSSKLYSITSNTKVGSQCPGPGREHLLDRPVGQRG